MKYKTRDLSKIFNVTIGTISKWARHGYLKGEFKRKKWRSGRSNIIITDGKIDNI